MSDITHTHSVNFHLTNSHIETIISTWEILSLVLIHLRILFAFSTPAFVVCTEYTYIAQQPIDYPLMMDFSFMKKNRHGEYESWIACQECQIVKEKMDHSLGNVGTK